MNITSTNSSKSSSSSSSSSAVLQTIRTMNQVWKDLNLPPPQISRQNHIILQDFLATKDTPTFHHHHHSDVANLELPHLPSPTALRLNSFCHDLNIIPPVFNAHDAIMDDSDSSMPHNVVGLFSLCNNNRVVGIESGFGGDRRYKRMMKNRESAARSRARKQAYTNELELEVAHLVAENVKLKKQNEELMLAMAAEPSTKKSMQRTLTAPF